MLITQDFYFHHLNDHRLVYLRVPEAPGPWPVMYYFDGHNLFRDADATYGKCWGLDAYLSRWDKPMLVVGVACSPTDRLSEYLPYGTGYGWLKGVVPRGEATMQAYLQELKPWVDSTFPTMPFRECTGIAGSSMGGLMAIYALVHHNQYFSKAACLSPSLGSVSGLLWREMNHTALSPDTRAYFSWGTQEGYGKIADPTVEDRQSWLYRTIRTTANKIEAAGGVARLYCQVGGRHCEADWEKQNGIYMPFLWQE